MFFPDQNVFPPLYAPAPPGVETRWASPENPDGARGAGGQANHGRKGRPSLALRSGETVTLAHAENAGGVVRRIWLTVSDRSPQMLRSLRLELFWDDANGAHPPAVSVPLGDFFGAGLGRAVPFTSALFANPEGRSFVCYVPMPFQTAMRVQLVNDGPIDLSHLFYEVNYTHADTHADTHAAGALSYLHAGFRRENPTTLQRDFEIVPPIAGAGRFLGCNIGVRADRETYGDTWWGEGEVKMYLDGDTDYPTLCGTGTEDYIGTAWAQGAFAHPFQGCPLADDARGEYAFYRWHLPDPVYFGSAVRVTLQQIGHCFGPRREALLRLGKPVYQAGPGLVPADLTRDSDHGVLFERQEDVSSCAYLYLAGRPHGGPDVFGPCAPLEARVADLAAG